MLMTALSLSANASCWKVRRKRQWVHSASLSFYIAPIGVAGEVTWSQVVEVPFDGCATSPKSCKACVRHTHTHTLVVKIKLHSLSRFWHLEWKRLCNQCSCNYVYHKCILYTIIVLYIRYHRVEIYSLLYLRRLAFLCPRTSSLRSRRNAFLTLRLTTTKWVVLPAAQNTLPRIAVHRDKLLRHAPSSSCAEVFGLYGDVMPRTVGLLIQPKCRQGKKCLQDFARNYVIFGTWCIYIYIQRYICYHHLCMYCNYRETSDLV